jgi:Zn/Cd-binding protein ZinT
MNYNLENKPHGQIVRELTYWFDRKGVTTNMELREYLRTGFPKDLKEINLINYSVRK